MTNTLDELVANAHAEITLALKRASSPVVAYSGGKDGLVAAHLVSQHGVRKGVCEMSFYFTQQKQDIRNTATRLGFDVAFEERRTDEWLCKHPEFFFATDSAARSRSFSLRQQRTVKRYAREHGHDMIIFGRRTEENTVKSILYEVDGYLSFNPIRNWRETHIWEYLERAGIPKPWVYNTIFGQKEGNAPFYSLRSSEVGGVDRAWQIVESIDPTINRHRYTR